MRTLGRWEGPVAEVIRAFGCEAMFPKTVAGRGSQADVGNYVSKLTETVCRVTGRLCGLVEQNNFAPVAKLAGQSLADVVEGLGANRFSTSNPNFPGQSVTNIVGTNATGTLPTLSSDQHSPAVELDQSPPNKTVSLRFDEHDDAFLLGDLRDEVNATIA